MRNIILTGGGTLGHVSPHFAIIPHLNFDNVYYVGSKTGIEKNFVKSKGLKYFEIDPIKLNRSFTFKNLLIPFKFVKSINESKKILKSLQPTVVFSKGGYVGLPVVIASKQLNIPVIVHESDLSIGLSNKIASKYADKTLTSFEKTAYSLKNGEYVGSPIREELFLKNKNEAYKQFNISKNKPVLLITGGSSGSKFINQLVINNLDKLLQKFSIIHIVGKNNLTGVKKPDYIAVEFADMALAYSICDICISRAGSNTAFELLSLEIPTLFIPLSKKSSRGDQIENANYFKNLNLCDVLFEEDTTDKIFIDKIFTLLKNKNYYINNLKNSKIKNGNIKIAKISIKCCIFITV